MTLTIAVAQTNPTQGDLAGNARQIIAAARSAHAQGAQLLLLPDGALTGLPLFDLAQRPAFVQACAQQVQAVATALADLHGLAVLLPYLHAGAATSPQPAQGGKGCACSPAGTPRALAILQGGQCRPCAGAEEAATPCIVDVQGLRLALLWGDAYAQPPVDASIQNIQQSGAQLLAVLGAAPYRMGAVQQREQALQALARATGLPLISAHLVGGQGERVFDGASLAVQANGAVAGRAPQFAESVWPVAASGKAGGLTLQASTAAVAAPDGWVGQWPGQPGQTAFAQAFNHAEVWQALVLGLRDYVRKNGFREVLLGLSGGMDSALVLALAVDALGRDQVRTLMMPTAYTADISLADAAEMTQRLGVRYDVLPIDALCAACDAALAPVFAGVAESRGPDVTAENIQARVRGNLLMALSNKSGALLLATGNKSELSVGYCTLYGDMAGGLAPIKDLFKTQVYALARWRNAHDPFGTGADPIPERIITRAPSAELRPDQTDQDSLPPYEVLDAILAGHVECAASVPQLLAAGLPREAVQQVLRLVRISAYKRQQAAPGLCLSRHAYGCDAQMPLVNRFAEEAGLAQ